MKLELTTDEVEAIRYVALYATVGATISGDKDGKLRAAARRVLAWYTREVSDPGIADDVDRTS